MGRASSNLCTVTDAHDPVDVRLHTVGRPLPGADIKIADPEIQRPLPPSEVGGDRDRRLHDAGLHCKDPEKNAAAFDAEGKR